MIDETPTIASPFAAEGPVRVWRNHNGRGYRWAIDTEDDGLGGHDTHGRCDTEARARAVAAARYAEREAMRRELRGCERRFPRDMARPILRVGSTRGGRP